MSITSAHTAPLPRDSASLILLRDAPSGLEVLLLRRHEQSQVLGGTYVFPGGKLDASDCNPEALATLDQDAPTLHTRMGEPELPAERAAGLFLAALREAHEEAGIELKHNGRWAVSEVLPWSRWITPRQPLVGSHRFDTRFFLAAMPQDQEARHDEHETTEAVWLTPREVLERHWAREMDLIPPQLMGLAQLARHRDVASVWQEALNSPVRCILPELFEENGVRGMCYPGDALHPVRERAMPGPTRLRFAGKRFEPFNGFAGWFE